ncbi:hypothetical protein JWS13_03395 (plasmid) [Rhodococcus pseudokoreensis]|uniref:DUF2933 domain-containing protein n=1 Tax=Rhodococcus pseudokoreensis TaxID=2811421 RepID=A0A974VY69_9NOCA|nr:hypothetical protein [Rhodococcus pseudokoreensis]QSE87704.1 hypothetical protein JWS13_03395 [Rhodococcus pseudokoreensis]
MQQLFLGLAVLACPVGMGLMMWMMMRGQGKQGDDASKGVGDASKGVGDASEQQQIRQLRAEIDALKSERTDRHGPREP